MQQKELLAARTNSSIVKSSYWPSVGLSAGWSTGFYETNTDDSGITIPFRQQFENNRHFSYGASVSIPLFNSFYRRHQVKLSRINEEIQEKTLDKTRSRLIYQIKDVMMQAESSLSEYQSAIKQLASDRAAFGAAEKKREKGLISIMDYYESKNNVGRSRVEVLRTEMQLFLNEHTLRYYKTGRYF